MKAKISLFIFLFCLAKALLVNYWHIIPLDRRTNGIVSWYIFLPLSAIGFVLSIICLSNYLFSKKGKSLELLALPMFLFGCYFFFTLVKAALTPV